ncbi:MAG: two-component system OmpR family sensor kinase [Oceanicoccus sp.]|jgi:two-component system OmpR family sensor kinase
MRKLTFSLLFVALIATVGLGWLFDQLYDQYNEPGPRQNTDNIHAIEQLGQALANTLSILPNRGEFIQSWQKKSQPRTSGKTNVNRQYQLEIVTVNDISLPKALLENIKQGTPLLLESNSHLAFHFYLAASDELLILKAPPLSTHSERKPLNYIFTLLFYSILLLLFFLWAYPLARRLLTLRQVAKSFGEGELKQRIDVSSISYIRDIEVEFNHMAQRIEDLVGDVKLLSSAVSHDLRTPLARIRFGIDTLQEEDDPMLRRRFEQKISDNVDEMTSLIETLLEYSRLDQVMLKLGSDPVNVSELVRSCIDNHKTNSVNIQFQQPKHDEFVNADKRYLAILINNLLQNAVNYGDGEILVRVFGQRDQTILEISDNGDGVADKEVANIFLPFVRGNGSKNVGSGHGVGLAIVKRIVSWHKGKISVSSSAELSGAKFIVTLPKNQSTN